MTKTKVRQALLALPVQDRLDLREEITISIARDENQIAMHPAVKRKLLKRLAEEQADPSSNISHQEMKRRLARLKRGLAAKKSGNGT